MVSDYLLGFAAEHYGFSRETLRFVAVGRDAGRQFYSFEKDGKSYILRVVKCPAGHINQTRAEMDWLYYLAAKGISVSHPLTADNGKFALPADDKGKTYIISAYSMAEGRLWDTNNPDLWNNKVFYNWGKVMGDMHRETKDFEPANEADRRPEFTTIISDGVKAFPTVNKAADELIAEIMALPKDRESYGLIHYDLGQPNFLIDGERINVFDFADCAYAWFALDIGVALTLGLWFGRHNDAGYDFTNDIIKHFLMGYLSANHLDDFWLPKIPMFMRLCQIAGFSIANHCEDPNDERQAEQIRNIENNVFLTGCAIDYSLFKNN